jgi:hypothetical protein
MNFNSYNLTALFEKSLIRITADFESTKEPKSAVSELSKLLKTKISPNEASSYNFQLKRTEDGIYHFSTSFMLCRDARLITIDLLKWIERNGSTGRNDNFLVDLKFLDEEKGPFKGTLFSTATKIDNIDKLKFILTFDEDKIYKAFPTRKDSFNSQSIIRFEPTQKFIPREAEAVDPRVYDIPSTQNCGINFETLNEGFLRMQYIGGIDYEKKVSVILDTINQFIVTSWDCVINKGFTKENLKSFEKAISIKEKVRQSYLDYDLFKKNFPKVKFTVDLVSDKKVLESYYNILRDRLFTIFSNCEFFNKEFEINYDSTLSIIQIRDAKIRCKNIEGLEFISCVITNGIFNRSDFYDCKIDDATFIQCNVYLDSIATRCNLIDSFSNRTTELIDCDFDGMNGVLNGKMTSGIFKTGKIGLFANVSNTTTVIQYQPLKSGYVVAGDQIIIPTKKFDKL